MAARRLPRQRFVKDDSLKKQALLDAGDRTAWLAMLHSPACGLSMPELQLLCGEDLQSLGGRPAMGSVLSKLYGRPDDPAPTFVDLMQGRPLVRNSARPGFLGPAYGPFRPDISEMFQRELEAGMKGELARLGGQHSLALTLDPALTMDRLDDRRGLLTSFDAVRRQVDASGMMEAMDRFHQQAVGLSPISVQLKPILFSPGRSSSQTW